MSKKSSGVAGLGDAAFIIFSVSLLAYIFATSYETAYLSNFGIPDEISTLFLQIDPSIYLYSAAPLLLIAFLITGVVDDKSMRVFHRHFSNQNPNKAGRIIALVTFLIAMGLGIALPTLSSNFALQWLGLMLITIAYTILVFELWLYKKVHLTYYATLIQKLKA